MKMLIFERIFKIQNSLNAQAFDRIFKQAECGAEHLWRQYSITYRSNLLDFWKYLSTDIKLLSMFKLGTIQMNAAETIEIVDSIYAAFKSSSGYLFGLPPGNEDEVLAVIRAFLRSEGRW